jgi:DNA-binding PadR family transcriptional regulator
VKGTTVPREPDQEIRKAIWKFLGENSGRTGREVARDALGLRNPAVPSGIYNLLRRMEKEGLISRELRFRAEHGRDVSIWYAVDGAF